MTVYGPFNPLQWEQLKEVRKSIAWSKDHPEAPTGRFREGIAQEEQLFKKLVNYR